MEEELEIRDLLVRCGSFCLTVPELVVSPGEIVTVFGPSGCGKTTLLNAIAGFVECERGTISLGPRRLEALPAEYRKTAMVFQRSALFSHLSLRENIEFGLKIQKVPRRVRQAEAESWLERIGLSGLGHRAYDQISEGQAQRVALARALAPGFPVLLLDEPFSALDDSTRGELRKLLKKFVEEKSVRAVLVTHQAEDARALSRRSLRLEGGRVMPGSDPSGAK